MSYEKIKAGMAILRFNIKSGKIITSFPAFLRTHDGKEHYIFRISEN